jgi:hypothetical protein
MEDRKKNSVRKSPQSYDLTRFNATRHGILSKHILLPWEPREEYEDLHHSLKQEYVPGGPTEEHLVEEIAGIIWRKRRLRFAETSTYRERFLKKITQNSSEIVRSCLVEIPPAVIDQHGVGDIFTINSEKASHELREAQKTLQTVQQVRKILKTEGPEKYQLALERLSPQVRESWEEASTGDEDLESYQPDYEPTPKGLLAFLDDEIIPDYSNRLVFLSHRGEIITQAQGEATDTERLEKLARYEVFLDRKLERTLSVLFKLQALRKEKEKEKEKKAIE